jgi:hypothetical protein
MNSALWKTAFRSEIRDRGRPLIWSPPGLCLVLPVREGASGEQPSKMLRPM